MITTMAVMRTTLLLLTVASVVSLADFASEPVSSKWPVPYRRVKSRPKSNPYCQAGMVPFCPTGRAANTMPSFPAADTIHVYAMKAPVWENKFGDLMGMFHIMHDAMGFHHVQSGQNFSMEWYELFQVFNCTFPHTLPNDTLLWCNQGATCIYDGIDREHWTKHGSLTKVADITGDIFNQFAKWVEWDNTTGIYYETWTAMSEPGGAMWFDSWECASWVLRAYTELGSLGAKFNQSVQLNYTRLNVYSQEPVLLGNASSIFGPQGNPTVAADILHFYRLFQSHQSLPSMAFSLLQVFWDTVVEENFYLYYNEQYWLLPVVKPYFGFTYKEVPLPSA